jgi:hypothetical protein
VEPHWPGDYPRLSVGGERMEPPPVPSHELRRSGRRRRREPMAEWGTDRCQTELDIRVVTGAKLSIEFRVKGYFGFREHKSTTNPGCPNHNALCNPPPQVDVTCPGYELRGDRLRQWGVGVFAELQRARWYRCQPSAVRAAD